MRVQPPGAGSTIGRREHAGELFTDRESESAAFESSLQAFHVYLRDSQDIGSTRNNLLTFYGVGGVGKTSLSRRMEAWVRNELPLENGWGPRPSTKVQTTLRVDLHGSQGVLDVVPFLLSLRRALTAVQRSWPTFDLAFAAYWSATHPNEDLPTYDGGQDFSDVVSETITNVLSDLGAAATGTGLGLRSMRRLIAEVRKRHHRRLAFAAFEGFADFMQMCVDEPTVTDPRFDIAADIAGLLAWEMSNLPEPPLFVAFIDTAERLKLDPRRVSESHLNRIVHNMPNVLFVVTGRDMIDWYDDGRLDLRHRGPAVWPGLLPGATTEPRQHRVGKLSPNDTRAVIVRAREQDHLPIPDEVVSQLVVASGGLPQYLELARQVATNIRDRSAREVRVEDVTGSLDSLVIRVLEDVPPDEQQAIRAACLFQTFDVPMAAAAADVDEGTAERAVLRPMVDHADDSQATYRIHDEIRRSIRAAGSRVVSGWSERDWKSAASRAAAEAKRRHDAAKSIDDHTSVIEAIALAVSVLCEIEVPLEPASIASYDDWLAQAIVYGPSLQAFGSKLPTTSQTDYGCGVLGFINGKSPEVPMLERIELLRAVFAMHGHPLAIPAGRHLAYTLKNLSRWDEALKVVEEVIAVRPSPVHLRQPAQILSSARRFLQAQATTERIGVEAAVVRRTERYAHGDPEVYFSEIEEKLTALQAAGRQREAIEDTGILWQRRAFFGRDFDLAEFRRFQEDVERIGHITALRDCLLIEVLERLGDADDIELALRRLRYLDGLQNEVFGFRFALAELVDAITLGDWARVDRLRDEIVTIPSERGRSWIPIECMMAAVGRPVPVAPTEWVEPVEVVEARWANYLAAHLMRHGVAPPFEVPTLN